MVKLFVLFCFMAAGCFTVEETPSSLDACNSRIEEIQAIVLETQAIGGPLLTFQAKCIVDEKEL